MNNNQKLYFGKYTKEEMSKGVKNPLWDKLCRHVQIQISHEDYKIFEDAAKEQDNPYVTAESIMSRCLKMDAKEIAEHD